MKNFTIAPRQFALAGKAIFTVVSSATGNRFTFKVSKGKKEGAPHFVSVLTGSDNENDYTFLGSIFSEAEYRHGFRSTITKEAPSAKAFEWVWSKINNLPESVQFLHAGKCCRCARTLTTPESIALGIGPECIKKMGM